VAVLSHGVLGQAEMEHVELYFAMPSGARNALLRPATGDFVERFGIVKACSPSELAVASILG